MGITIWDGIIIGGVGGAIAGMAVWLINLFNEIVVKKYDKYQLHKWLYTVTKQNYVADWNNISENNSETEKFRKFLTHDLCINWAGNAEIRKSDNTRNLYCINLTKDENAAELKCNKTTEKATLKIRGGKTYNLTIKEENGKRNIYKEQWRSTRTIASYCNVTEDRVRYICSIDERIGLSTGEKEDLWGIKKITRPDNDDQKCV